MSESIQTAIPGDVRALARERGVEHYLEPLLAVARRNFAGTSPRMAVEDDPEIEDLRHIVILIRNRQDVDLALAAREAYYRDVFAIVPAPLVCEFRLGLESSE
jgi:hypothetical protein